MTDSVGEHNQRASVTADRLRRLDAEPADSRRGHIHALIDEALAGLPPTDHARLVAEIVDRLLPCNGAANLQAASVIPAETRAKLQVGAADSVDPARVIDLCGVLAELASSLDQVMWTAWSKNIATRSTVKRNAPLARTISRYVVNDPEAPRSVLTNDVDALRRLSAALIAAVGRVGRLFAQRHLQKYSVQAIAEAAPSAGLMKSKESACWQHYVKLMTGVEDESINQEIMQLIAESVDQVLRGRMGGSS